MSKGFLEIQKAPIDPLIIGSVLDKGLEGPLPKAACPAERQSFLSAQILNYDSRIEPYSLAM